MNVNIVTVSSGWILQKIAERTAKYNTHPDVNFTVSHRPNFDADVNYYVDLQNCYNNYKTKFDVAYFTHADLNSKQWVIDLFNQTNAWQLDGIKSMNRRYTDMLAEIGYPKEKLATITPGQTHDTFPLSKIRIGVVSRGGHAGYGQQFMERFLESCDVQNFHFMFLGGGWDALIPICQRRGISITLIQDESYDFYPQFYDAIEYLLIPGLWTAGPMSMQEALSSGKPVIGADVGFVNYEFKADYVFEANNTEQLYSILRRIETPRLERRNQVKNMTWEKYSHDLCEFIIRLKNNKI